MTLETKKMIFDFVKAHHFCAPPQQSEISEKLLSDFIEKAEAGNEMAGIFLAEWLLTCQSSECASARLELFFT
ncbi:MAG: hypothetical protein PWQ12_2156 [Clostridiales bacterium]|jgi:hypothetical protein|nr:hypothetical protein [Clostridiales bacterium]